MFWWFKIFSLSLDHQNKSNMHTAKDYVKRLQDGDFIELGDGQNYVMMYKSSREDYVFVLNARVMFSRKTPRYFEVILAVYLADYPNLKEQ